MARRAILSTLVLSAVLLAAAFGPRKADAGAPPTLGAQFDIQAFNAAYDATLAASAFSPNSGTILVIWRRAETPDVPNQRQDEVRGSLYQAGCEGNTALDPILEDFLIIQQDAPATSNGEEQLSRITVFHNPVSDDYIVVAGGQSDPDDNAPTPGTDDDPNTGEVHIQRVNANDGTLDGTTVVLSNGITTADGAIIANSQVTGAASNATGNIVVTFGVQIVGAQNGHLSSALAMFDSNLVRLDTAGPRFFMGTATIWGSYLMSEIPPHTGAPAQFIGVVALGGGSTIFDPDTGKFLVSTRQLFTNSYPLGALLGQISPPEVVVATIDDGVTAGAVTRGPLNIVVQADFQADGILTVDDLGPEPGNGQAVDDARIIKNPYSNANGRQYLLVYRPARIWGISQHTSGITAQFFGLSSGGSLQIGPMRVVADQATSAAQEQANQPDYEDAPQIDTTCEFAGRNFLLLFPDDGENNDPVGTTGRRNAIRLYALDENLDFALGTAVNTPIDLRLVGPGNAANDPDLFSDVDTQDISDVPGRGYVLTVWDERSNTATPAETRHPVARVAGVPLAPNSGPCIVVHPKSQSVEIDTPVTLSVAAVGVGTLTYQWRKDTVDISGETNPTLSFPMTVVADTGSYDCVVTDDDGNRTSKAADLTVTQILGSKFWSIFE